jgi:hypothetical protein
LRSRAESRCPTTETNVIKFFAVVVNVVTNGCQVLDESNFEILTS